MAPVIGLLIVGIYYFMKKEGKYQEEIKELNQVIRDNEKESLTMFSKLAIALDRISDSKGEIHQEIVALKEFISIKLDQINNRK